jgi:hypothetical protein
MYPTSCPYSLHVVEGIFCEIRSVEGRGAYAWLVLAPAGVTTIAATWSSLR